MVLIYEVWSSYHIARQYEPEISEKESKDCQLAEPSPPKAMLLNDDWNCPDEISYVLLLVCWYKESCFSLVISISNIHLEKLLGSDTYTIESSNSSLSKSESPRILLSNIAKYPVSLHPNHVLQITFPNPDRCYSMHGNPDTNHIRPSNSCRRQQRSFYRNAAWWRSGGLGGESSFLSHLPIKRLTTSSALFWAGQVKCYWSRHLFYRQPDGRPSWRRD